MIIPKIKVRLEGNASHEVGLILEYAKRTGDISVSSYDYLHLSSGDQLESPGSVGAISTKSEPSSTDSIDTKETDIDSDVVVMVHCIHINGEASINANADTIQSSIDLNPTVAHRLIGIGAQYALPENITKFNELGIKLGIVYGMDGIMEHQHLFAGRMRPMFNFGALRDEGVMALFNRRVDALETGALQDAWRVSPQPTSVNYRQQMQNAIQLLDSFSASSQCSPLDKFNAIQGSSDPTIRGHYYKLLFKTYVDMFRDSLLGTALEGFNAAVEQETDESLKNKLRLNALNLMIHLQNETVNADDKLKAVETFYKDSVQQTFEQSRQNVILPARLGWVVFWAIMAVSITVTAVLCPAFLAPAICGGFIVGMTAGMMSSSSAEKHYRNKAANKHQFFVVEGRRTETVDEVRGAAIKKIETDVADMAGASTDVAFPDVPTADAMVARGPRSWR